DTQIEANQASAGMGTSVAGAGDVNGDGYADVILGAPLFDAGETDEGAAFVFLGGASGIADGDPVSADTQIEADQASAGMGTHVAGAGDVNGDGYADVILGAPLFDAGETDEGAAFVFLGSASGIPDAGAVDAAIQLEADQPEAQFGSSVASASDVDGDGFADVIVGAALFDAGEMDEGAAFVFLGGASGIADGDP
ncbi:MAG: integrin alpha, partial [Candidatus Poseidoniia archaeon]|nr:integrin alpha [Candidatus Poseidoniia archaeon]